MMISWYWWFVGKTINCKFKGLKKKKEKKCVCKFKGEYKIVKVEKVHLVLVLSFTFF